MSQDGKEVNMADNLTDIFEKINASEQPDQINQTGVYESRIRKVERSPSGERIVEIVRIQKVDQSGILNVIEEIRYLCQGCNSVMVTPGIDKFTNDEKILCEKCSRKAKIRSLSKPLWGLFIKFGEKK